MTVSFDFNRSLKIVESDQRLSADAGAMLLRELDDRLGFTATWTGKLYDPRHPALIDYSLPELVRSRVLLLGLGRQDQNDADAFRHDPAFCAAVADMRGDGACDRPLASQSSQSRLLNILAIPKNRRAVRWAPTDLAINCQQSIRKGRLSNFTLDLDSSDIETYGHQEGANYNGHYEHTCYHPLFAFAAETGDLVGGWFRRGNVASQRGAAAFASELLDRLEGKYGNVGAVRGDAAFAVPRLMLRLEKRGTKYVFRLKTNPVLDRLAAPYLKPTTEPPTDGVLRQWLFELTYKAQSWEQPRRVVLVVVEDQEKFMGTPVFRHFFLVTNYTAEERNAADLLHHYRERGTAETWIGEFKNEISPLLSSPTFVENRSTFALAMIAFQLLHMLRVGVTTVEKRPARVSLKTLRQDVLKTAARFIHGQRRILIKLAPPACALWTLLIAWLQT